MPSASVVSTPVNPPLVVVTSAFTEFAAVPSGVTFQRSPTFAGPLNSNTRVPVGAPDTCADPLFAAPVMVTVNVKAVDACVTIMESGVAPSVVVKPPPVVSASSPSIRSAIVTLPVAGVVNSTRELLVPPFTQRKTHVSLFFGFAMIVAV